MPYSIEYHDAAGWAGTEHGVHRLSLAKDLARAGVEEAEMAAGLVRDARGRTLFQYPRVMRAAAQR